MNGEHYIVICCRCSAVVKQCRCKADNKHVVAGICADCKTHGKSDVDMLLAGDSNK